MNKFSIPAPKIIFKPILYIYLALRWVVYFVRRVFYAEPLFKAYCKQYGENVHTDIRLHWVNGKGDIILGDNVLIDGHCAFTFACRFVDRPTLRIGNNADVGSGCQFVVAKEITIGDNCQLGPGVTLRDSDGHATDPEARRRGQPPVPEAVRPIRIEDNVWIGAGSVIGPGVTIAEGSIVAARSVVNTSVPPYTVVSGNPARKVSSLAQSATPNEPRPVPVS